MNCSINLLNYFYEDEVRCCLGKKVMKEFESSYFNFMKEKEFTYNGRTFMKNGHEFQNSMRLITLITYVQTSILYSRIIKKRREIYKMSNITNFLSAINEANQLKKDWQVLLDGLTPELFQQALKNDKSIDLKCCKLYDQMFEIRFQNKNYLDYAVNKMKDMGFVHIFVCDDLSINFKVPQSSINDYIKSINDAIITIYHESDHILKDITPKLIKDMEMGSKYRYFQKTSSGYSINFKDFLTNNEEAVYVVDQLKKMGFSNIQWVDRYVHFEIK